MDKTIDSKIVSGHMTTRSFLKDMTDGLKSISDPIAMAARKFRKDLPEFYRTTADRIENAPELKYSQMFERDAIRYNTDEDGSTKKTPRGILSQHWAKKILETGGDLPQTFSGTLPQEDIALIKLGADAGANALPTTLRDLARISLLIRRAKTVFLTSTLIGFLSVLVMLTVMALTPWYTVPTLKKSFSLPPEMMPGIATSLFQFSDFVADYLFFIVAAVAFLIYVLLWSLPNYVGKHRRNLDKFFIWGLYRDMQGALFVAVLSTMVKKRGNISDNLLFSLHQMNHHTTPWRRWHISRMIQNIENLSFSNMDIGSALTNALDTGVMDRESFFYLVDVQEGQGLAIGLQKAGERIEGPTLNSVQRQARVIAIGMLIASLSVVGMWVIVHLMTANAMISSLRNYLSS